MISIYTEDFDNVIVIHLVGTFTPESLKEVEDSWNEQLEKRPEVLAFDFKGIEEIDSISINHIFKLVKNASKTGVKLVICDINEDLEKMFSIIKLDKVIPIMPKQKFYEEYIRKL